MSEEIKFTKKLNSGLHRFKYNGKTYTVKPGETVVCTAEALGSAILSYNFNDSSLANRKRQRRERNVSKAILELKSKGAGYYDIVNIQTGEKLNEKGLRKKDAEQVLKEMLDHLSKNQNDEE